MLMPLEPSAGRFLLRRPLLYTAVSRAQRLLLLVGTQGAMDTCIHNAGGHTHHAHHSTAAAATAAGGGGGFGSGWAAEVQRSRMVAKLRAGAAARDLQPFPRMVFGPEGWQVQQ